MKNITSRSILLLTLALSLTPCWSYNVVIEQESQCNEPLRESANKTGDPTELIFKEYLDYVNNSIESEQGREKLNQPDIISKLQDVFDSLANKTCITLLGVDACKKETIFIHDDATNITTNATVFLFNICEKGFEFINNNIDNTAAPSLSPIPSPTLSPTNYPPKQVDHTLQIGEDGDESEVNQTILNEAFQTLVRDVVIDMNKDEPDLIHKSTVFIDKKACLPREPNETICFDYNYVTLIYLNETMGNKDKELDKITKQLQSKVDAGVKTDEFKQEVCGDLSCRILYFLQIETGSPEIVGPLITGIGAGAMFFLLWFVTNSKRRNRNNSDDDSKIDIEVGFPIPSIHENSDLFELEQRVPFTDDNENVFSASFD